MLCQFLLYSKVIQLYTYIHFLYLKRARLGVRQIWVQCQLHYLVACDLGLSVPQCPHL